LISRLHLKMLAPSIDEVVCIAAAAEEV
jgi:hypothetical protein